MKWNTGIMFLAVVAVAMTFTLSAGAQSTNTTDTDAKDPTIAQRKENQQDRIAQGVNSGQLTAGETANLEHKEGALNAETRDMREDDGGKLTAKDKAVVNQQQNKLSRQIYRDKHNGRKQ
jgi:hypothetical protein